MNSDIFENDIDIVLYNFNEVLKLLIFCYKKIISEISFSLVNEKEPIIRNIFIKYLEKLKYKFNLGRLSFEPEVGEIKDNNEILGFIDIKVGNVEGTEENDRNKYFAFECKRLDGKAKHKKEYIDNGLSRFILGQYSKNMQLSGMIGFVQGFKKGKNILDNIGDIKDYLETKSKFKKYTIHNLKKIDIEKKFNYSYVSKHERKNGLGNIEIYHLFFDFTS